MPPLRVLPYRQIAEEIAARLAERRGGRGALEPWDEEVLVPSRGVAEAVSAALLERMPRGVAGLRIHTLENLAQRLVNAAGEMPHVATPEERRLAMRIAARSLDDAMRESRGISAMLERSYRDLRDSGLSLGEFGRRAAQQRRLRDRNRSAAVLRAWREYERLVARLGAIDPADLLLRAAALAGPHIAPQLLAGFYDMTGVQLALVRALLESDRIAGVWIPTAEPFAHPFLGALGFDAPEPRSPAAAVTPAVQRCDTRIDEMRIACASAAALLREGVPAHDIAIVARSFEPYDVRLLNRIAAESGFGTTLGEPLPLHAHPIGRGAATLLRLRDHGFPRGEVIELVRAGIRTRTRLDADRADVATRRARIAGGTAEELSRMRNRPAAVDEYIALVAELEELTSDVSSLVPRLGSLFRVETEHDLAAAEALEQIAALFRRAAVWNRPVDASSVLDAIEQATIPSRDSAAPRPCVWAGDVMRFRGRSFAHVFVLRMEDDVFPQRRLEDPLLPDSDRRLLGVREIGDGAAEERLLLSLVGSAASSSLRFFWAGGDGFGKVLRASRYVRGMQPAGFPAPGGGHEDEPRSANLDRQLALLVHRARSGVFDGFVGPLEPPVAAKLQSLSPTQLEDFGECPQKFLFKHVLGAEDIDRPERELQINPRDKGSADHEILERFYRSTSEEEINAAAPLLPELEAKLAARLERLVDEQFDKLADDAPPFNGTVREIERRATKRLLREFLVRDLADLVATGLRPKHFEYRFGRKHRTTADHPEPFVVPAAGSSVRVEGTIDRIDSDGARLRIIDYKSGKAIRHKDLGAKIDRGVRLQLALYAMAVADFFRTEPQKVSGAIRPLVTPDSRNFDFELAEKHARLLETLEIFLAAIPEGKFPAFPDEEKIESCKYCPVNHSCRSRHDLDEKSELLRASDARSLLTGDAE